MSAFSTTARPKPFTVDTAVDVESLLERIPPHDLHAETMVLGSMIKWPKKTVAGICDFIDRPEIFFKEENQRIFEVIRDLHYAGTPVGAMVIISALKNKNLLEDIGGETYIAELIEAVPVDLHAEYFAAQIKEKSMLRETISACTITLRECYYPQDHAAGVIDRGEARFHKIATQKEAIYPTPLSEIMPELVQTFDDADARKRLVGLPTGYTELDELTGGLLNGDMIVIAARPSVGKTSFAFNIIENIGIEQGKTCVMFSLEMRKQQLAIRTLSSRAGVNSRKLKRGELDSAERKRVGHAASELCVNNVFIDDTPAITLRDVRNKSLRLKERHGLDLIALDYLGLMTGDRRENKVQETAVLSAGIKALARELDVPFLCLSQLNRDCERDKRLPQISDLRNSGDIEQDADMVILLHREICYHRGDQQWIDANQDKINEAVAIVAKQRNGPCENIRLTYIPSQTRFIDYQPGIF